MDTRKINGTLFEGMMEGGLRALALREQQINALNVFPVADGDTGTNMRLTLESGLRGAKSSRALCDYLKALSGGMLLGARGNSGVILSQLFKGIYLELSRAGSATPAAMRNAFIRAYRVAYESVIKPVEGTILTVAREGIERTGHRGRYTDMESLFTDYIVEMRRSLETTPEKLPVLAEMGVVDSGGMGYITILEGMLKGLKGEPIDDGGYAPRQAAAEPAQPDLSLFGEDSDFEQGYCMEFILQLMRKPPYSRDFQTDAFVSALELLGESIVAVRDEGRVKVHIHTRKPAPIIELSQTFGEFLTFKLENMQLQHNEYMVRKQPPAPHKALAVIAMVNGEGCRQVFEALGCDTVIEGGPSMNASAQEFLTAIRSLDADAIAILPDNPNAMLAARQAVNLAGAGHAQVLDARTVAEGYYALAMDMPDSDDAQRRLGLMREGIDSIETLMITRAARDYAHNGVSCQENEYIAVSGNDLAATADSAVDAVIAGLRALEDIEDRESCIFFRGEGADPDDEAAIEARVLAAWPMMDVSFVPGGQAVYEWIIGIM